jgi:hypothetical protein
MNEITKPAALLAGVSTLGLVSTSIYFSNKTAALNKSIADINDDIDTIKDGLKEKVPALENQIKNVDHGLRNIAGGMQTFAVHNKKVEKKFGKTLEEVGEMSEALDKIDDHMVRLIEALVSKGVISQDDIDPPQKPQPIQRSRSSKQEKKSSKHYSEDEEEEVDESSEEEQPRRRSSSNKGRSSRSVPAPRRQSPPKDDGDDIDAVVRMASGRR